MRELVTTLLDLIGLVAVVVAVALYILDRFGLPYAVGTFGVGMIVVSTVITLRAPKPAEPDEADI